jgi:preprotein translocase subunit SecE
LTKQPQKKKSENAVRRFIRETVGELRKVTWPSRREALNLTGLVIVVMVFTSLVLSLFEAIAQYLLGLLLT